MKKSNLFKLSLVFHHLSPLQEGEERQVLWKNVETVGKNI